MHIIHFWINWCRLVRIVSWCYDVKWRFVWLQQQKQQQHGLRQRVMATEQRKVSSKQNMRCCCSIAMQDAIGDRVWASERQRSQWAHVKPWCCGSDPCKRPNERISLFCCFYCGCRCRCCLSLFRFAVACFFGFSVCSIIRLKFSWCCLFSWMSMDERSRCCIAIERAHRQPKHQQHTSDNQRVMACVRWWLIPNSRRNRQTNSVPRCLAPTENNTPITLSTWVFCFSVSSSRGNFLAFRQLSFPTHYRLLSYFAVVVVKFFFSLWYFADHAINRPKCMAWPHSKHNAISV